MEQPSIEKVSIWILEVLEEERQREPNWLKCRLAKDVLGALKTKHGLDDARIKHGLDFCFERGYVKALAREDGQVVALDTDGVRMFALIQQSRLDEAKAEAAAQKAETERGQDVRLRIYQIIIALLAVLVSYLGYRLWK
jgi:hypothetical protein